MNKVSEKIYTNQGNPDVLKCISNNALTILDVGCGNGDNARILMRHDRTIDGITLSEQEAKNALSYLSSVYIHNLENGLPKQITKQYDAVICSHVLEHIAYSEKLLQDIKDRLNPKGVLIVALPNIMGYRPRLRLLMGNFDYEEAGIWDNTHLRWYTFESGKKMLENNGFYVVKADVTGDIPFGTIFKFISFDFRQKIFRLLTKISKGFFGGQLLYVACKSSLTNSLSV
jgi:SAM-dependent methyltransferase